jgi:hypothetical protein
MVGSVLGSHYPLAPLGGEGMGVRGCDMLPVVAPQQSVSVANEVVIDVTSTSFVKVLPVTRSTLARRLLKLAACVTLVFVVSGLAYAGYAWWTAPLFADDFKSGWFDSRKWRAPPEIIKEGGVFPEKGHIRLINRGYLVTNQEFKEPIEISFEWRWSQLGLLPQYADDLTVVLRTTGKAKRHRTYEVEDGVVIRFVSFAGSIFISSGPPERALYGNVNPPLLTIPLPAEEWHRIRVTDNGETIAVFVSGPAIPEQQWSEPLVKLATHYRGLANHVAVYNRELVAGIPHESSIRAFRVHPLR